MIWAGAVRPKTAKNKKVNCDGPTDRPMEGPTKRGVKSRSTRLKISMLDSGMLEATQDEKVLHKAVSAPNETKCLSISYNQNNV